MTILQTDTNTSAAITGQAGMPQWRDWRWQLRHAIRDIDTFEQSLGVRLAPDERRKVERTLSKFPLSITPYYLSLIDTDDIENDPVFKQAFPSPRELDVC